MKPSFFGLIILFMCLTSCKRQHEVKAIIYERKIMENNRLLIHFRYELDGKEYKDSTVIINTVLENDTILIRVGGTSPEVVTMLKR